MKRLIVVAALLGASALPAMAQQYEFAPTPHQGLNRVYRVDRVTGEMGACQYGPKDGGVGLTICYPAGEGAKAAAPSDYGLIASQHISEAGIFRINRRTGEMSICYVLNDELVVCTPPSK